jgi:hypothetical protein
MLVGLPESRSGYVSATTRENEGELEKQTACLGFGAMWDISCEMPLPSISRVRLLMLRRKFHGASS